MNPPDGIQPTTATGGPDNVLSRPGSPAATIGTPDAMRGAQASLDLDRIEATARAVVRGDSWWEADDIASPDGEYIATMDPSTTLALVARVRELEAEMGERIFWLDQDAGLIAEAMERLSAAEAQLKGRCLADITLRDDDHRMVTCILPEGHTFEHDDGMGCLWTDGGHRVADHSDAARLAAVDRLHQPDLDWPHSSHETPEVECIRCEYCACRWRRPCPTHLAIHPECSDGGVGGGE